MAVGAAVDFARASSAKSIIQNAADSAALAAAANKTMTDSQLLALVNDFLKANGVQRAVATIQDVNLTVDKKSGLVAVEVKGKFNTSLMQMAGISTLDIDATSEVQTGAGALEVALVLDNTYSMTADGRIDALKKASHAMLDELFDGSGGGSSDVKVSVVPFSEYVNVGLDKRNETWIDVKADYDEALPNYVSSNCHTVSSSQDGVSNTNDQICDWTLDPSGATWTKQNRWTGCVGSRNNGLDTRIDNIQGNHYTGLLNGEHPTTWWISCPQPVVPLTADKSKLSASINSMVPTGETYIPAGLLWGWNVLDSEKPFVEAKTTASMTQVRGTKVLVLMTDGDNTIKPVQYPWHFKTDGSANWGAVADQKAAELCNRIKADGITVYTVALKVTNDGSRQMLENCASSPGMAFNADDNTALVTAFKSIAHALAAVHISR